VLMSRLNYEGKIVFVIIALALCCFLQQTTDIPSIQLGGRSVTPRLMRVEDRALVSWKFGDGEIVTVPVLVGPNTNIPDLLAKMGINPDSGAYSLLYDLNPTVAKLDALPPDTKLVMPKVTDNSNLRKKLADGSHLVVLSVDLQLRQELNSTSTKLPDLASRFAALQPERFPNDTVRRIATKQVTDVGSWFEHIRKSNQMRIGPPTSRATLVQLNDEAGILTSLLVRFLSGSGRLNSDDQDQITSIHDDIELEITRYDDILSGQLPESDLAPCCTLTVNILGGNREEIKKLRVYYAINGYYHEPPPDLTIFEEFGELGSGRSATLRHKKYRIWAAPDGHPSQVLTNEMKIYPLHKEQTIEISLKGSSKPLK